MVAALTRRKSAEERREEILAIAIEHFAARGFRGTSTEVFVAGVDLVPQRAQGSKPGP